MSAKDKADQAEVKEWIKVGHSQGRTTVTVTLLEGTLSVKWQVKTFVNEIKSGVAEARGYAQKALADLREVAGDG